MPIVERPDQRTMLDRLARARLLWPTLATAVGLCVLVGLGAWQWQRKAWKEDLIARITARTKAPPVSLDAALGAYTATGVEDVEYTRVRLEGRFLHEKERYMYATAAEGPGWHVLTPLEFGADRTVWVNRGYVPEGLRSPGVRHASLVSGAVSVTGYVRQDTPPGMFTPANEPARNIWYHRDVAGLDASAFPPGHRSVPFLIEATEQSPSGDLWPRPGVTRIALPNKHLEYAFTWWGLAATLIGVYAAFAVGRWRAASAPGEI